MAKRIRYSKWALAAIIGGVVLTAIEVVGAVGYLVQQDQPSYLIASGAVVTVVAAMLVPLAERCWQEGRRILASLLALSLVPALSLILSAAVEWTGGASDEANRNRQAVARQIELKRAAVNEAKAVAAEDEAAAKAECATGRKGKCLGLEARADQSRQRLEAARTALAQAGVIPIDPAGAASRGHPAGLRRGDSALSADHPAGLDLSRRAALDRGRHPYAEAPLGEET
jgi:hypothetical protein